MSATLTYLSLMACMNPWKIGKMSCSRGKSLSRPRIDDAFRQLSAPFPAGTGL